MGVGFGLGGTNAASRCVVAEAFEVQAALGCGVQETVATFVVVVPPAVLIATSAWMSTDWLAISVPRLQRSMDPLPVIEQEPWLGWWVMRVKRAPFAAGSLRVTSGAGSGPPLLTRMS